ncbi:MAG: DUF1566 domain-containing protein, partial [Nitrospirae bacterium]|nr:DUF1566 domain-containing protein [Nitrospirota bacterium]
MFETNNNRKMKHLRPHDAPGVRALLTLALIVLIGAMCLGSAAYAGTVSLPQTGQVTSYDTNTPQRDDGALRIGVAWPVPRFTVNSDQTVTDTLTGLVWTKDASTPTVGSCTGGKMTWQAALDYVACLNTASYLGHNDWRLPNINELESLVNAGQANTAWLQSQGFANVKPDNTRYWSSTTHAYYTSYAWEVNMYDGYVIANEYNTNNKTSINYYVWPVRSGQSTFIWATGQSTIYAAGDDGALKTGVSWPNT